MILGQEGHIARVATGSGVPLRVGVIGLGYFGSHHARHYAGNDRARLVAVADTDPQRAAAAGERYGCDTFSDHKALIGRVEAASIATTTSEHPAVACDLIEAGIHVFVEKPIAVDPADAAELVARAERRGVVLQVGHIERFSPAFQALRDRVRDPRLIACVRRAEWKGRAADVDVVLDLMIHDIDLVLSLVGAPVVSVDAVGASVVTSTNDVAEATLRFANGVEATLTASRIATSGERIMAVATPGRYFVADFAAPSLAIVGRAGPTPENATGAVRSEIIPLTPADNLAAEVDSFLECAASGKTPVVDGRAGLAALEVADVILAAISGKRTAAPKNVQRRV